MTKLKTLVYYSIVLIIVCFIIRDAILASFNMDMIGISIILFQVFLLMLILRRGSLTQVGIIGWSIIFIVKNMIPFVGMILEHHHNDYINAESKDLITKGIKILIAIIFWVVAVKVSFDKSDTPKS